MKQTILSIFACAMSLCSYAQNFNIKVQVADTTGVALYIQADKPSESNNARLEYKGKAFEAQCPQATTNFYNLTIMKDGGQYNIPVYAEQKDANLALEFKDGVPSAIKYAKDNKANAANIQAINDYFTLSIGLARDFWMNMRQMDAAKTTDYVTLLKAKATEIDLRQKVSMDVKHYIDIWAYLDGYNMIDSYNRSHEDHIQGNKLLLLTPPEVLNNKIALLHHSALMVAYINVPKKDLPSRIAYVREHYSVPEVRTALETSVLDNFLRFYNFNSGSDRGLQEILAAQEQYGIDVKYAEQFREKLAAVSGAPFPADVVIETEDGTRIDFAQFRGKYVYVDLWASWCVPCVKEVPHLKALEMSLQNDKVVFVSISCDTDRNAWLKKKEDLALHGNQFINADNKLCNKLNVNGIPRFLIYDPQGNLLNPNAPRPSSEEIKPLLEGLK